MEMRRLLFPIFLCLLGGACGRLPDAWRMAAPEILGIEATEITETEATLVARVQGRGRMAGAGFVYAKAADGAEAVSDAAVALPGTGTMSAGATMDGETFTARISGLEDGATYVFEAYADNGAGLQCRSEARLFRTKAFPVPDDPNEPDGPDTPDQPDNPDPDNPDQPEIPSYIDIPDDHFRAWVLWNYDTDKDGRLCAQEARLIEIIELNTDETASLEGIHHFPNLHKIHAEGSLTDGEPRGQLSTLDLSGNPLLTMLYLPHNRITTLDPSPAPLLTRLEMPHNLLESIDLSQLKQISLLSLAANRLVTLDVRGLHQLDELHCDENPLTELQLNNANLRYLNCAGTQLSLLDLRKCPKLNDLDCTDCPRLERILLQKGQTIGVIRKDDHTQLSYE
jgi:hypothetical protein